MRLFFVIALTGLLLSGCTTPLIGITPQTADDLQGYADKTLVSYTTVLQPAAIFYAQQPVCGSAKANQNKLLGNVLCSKRTVVDVMKSVDAKANKAIHLAQDILDGVKKPETGKEITAGLDAVTEMRTLLLTNGVPLPATN